MYSNVRNVERIYCAINHRGSLISYNYCIIALSKFFAATTFDIRILWYYSIPNELSTYIIIDHNIISRLRLDGHLKMMSYPHVLSPSHWRMTYQNVRSEVPILCGVSWPNDKLKGKTFFLWYFTVFLNMNIFYIFITHKS